MNISTSFYNNVSGFLIKLKICMVLRLQKIRSFCAESASCGL